MPESAILHKDGIDHIYDIIRKKWLILTPEEWVRQHLIFDLLQKGYPPQALSVEKSFKVYSSEKRFDVAVFARQGLLLLFECKKASEALSEKVLQQAIRYNITLQSPFIGITNGIDHYIFRFHKNNYIPVSRQIPEFNVLLQSL